MYLTDIMIFDLIKDNTVCKGEIEFL